MKILAIDQGTTSTKSAIFENGKLDKIKMYPHGQIIKPGGIVEQDPLEILRNIKQILSDNPAVQSIGLSNQGESVIAWDKETKKPVSNVIVWQDSRTAPMITVMKQDGLEKEVLSRSRLPLDPYFSASKISWILKNIPETDDLLKRNKLRISTLDAYFLDVLCDQYKTDLTTASRTSLMHFEKECWDEELCRMFGIPIDILPEIVDSTGEIGVWNQIPITASVVDQQASLFGHGCHDYGDSKFTFGTGAFFLGITDKKQSEQFINTIALKPNNGPTTYALDSGLHTVFSTLQWAKKMGLWSSFDEIDHFEKPAAIDRGLMFVPSFVGLEAPYHKKNIKGFCCGISLDTDKLDMVQALIEGIAFRAAEIVRAFEKEVKQIKEISIDGGFSKNSYFRQFFANVLQKTVRLPKETEQTLLGIGKLAGLFFDKTYEIDKSDGDFLFVNPTTEFNPNFNLYYEFIKKNLGTETLSSPNSKNNFNTF